MKRTTTMTATVGLASALLIGSALVRPSLAMAAPPVPTCSLEGGLIVTAVSPDVRTQQFSDYGDSSGEWIGADSTYSVPLNDGTTAWLFSDTVLGSVVDGAVDMETLGFVNQSIVLEDAAGNLTRTVTGGGTGTLAQPLFAQPTPDAWYWLGAGLQHPNGTLQVGLNRYDRFGPGLWDWSWSHTEIGTIDPKTWTVTSTTSLEIDSDVQWTAWYQRTQGKTYIYGTFDGGWYKQGHVARVAGWDLTRIDKWEFWTGSGWSRKASDSRPFLDNVANEYSVTPFRDGYLLVTHDTSEVFSNKVVAYTSCNPTGPFTNQTELFRTPETGASGSYQDPNIFTYNSHLHPQLSDDHRLLISYNVNTLDNEHIFDDVTIYRPRFFTVTLS